jgi:hypothetical protein
VAMARPELVEISQDTAATVSATRSPWASQEREGERDGGCVWFGSSKPFRSV